MIRSLEELRAAAPVPTADHFGLFMCPACPNAHLVMFDADDQPIAMMTIAPRNLDHIQQACDEIFMHNNTAGRF